MTENIADTYVNRFESMTDIVGYRICINDVMNRKYSPPTEREFFDFAFQARKNSSIVGAVPTSHKQFFQEMFNEGKRNDPNYEVAVYFIASMLNDLDPEGKINMEKFADVLMNK